MPGQPVAVKNDVMWRNSLNHTSCILVVGRPAQREPLSIFASHSTGTDAEYFLRTFVALQQLWDVKQTAVPNR